MLAPPPHSKNVCAGAKSISRWLVCRLASRGIISFSWFSFEMDVLILSAIFLELLLALLHFILQSHGQPASSIIRFHASMPSRNVLSRTHAYFIHIANATIIWNIIHASRWVCFAIFARYCRARYFWSLMSYHLLLFWWGLIFYYIFTYDFVKRRWSIELLVLLWTSRHFYLLVIFDYIFIIDFALRWILIFSDIRLW